MVFFIGGVPKRSVVFQTFMYVTESHPIIDFDSFDFTLVASIKSSGVLDIFHIGLRWTIANDSMYTATFSILQRTVPESY